MTEMSLGEAWWFIGRTVERVPQQVLELLQCHGFQYRHPNGDRVWALDEVGSRREVSLEFVFGEWTASRALTIQLWIDADADILITIEPEPSLVTFDFDGLRLGDARALVAALLLGARTKLDTPLLVVDRFLPERGAEWSRVASGLRPIPYQPDLLLLRGSNGDQMPTVSPASWLARPADPGKAHPIVVL